MVARFCGTGLPGVAAGALRRAGGPAAPGRWASGSRRAAAGKVRFALVDIDGTLATTGGAIPGAAAALERLRAGVAGVRFVTNQSQEASSRTLARLQSLGLGAEHGEVFSCLAAARRIVDSQELRPLLLLTPLALEEFEGVPTHDPDAVVLGTAPDHLHYEGLTEAMRVLQGNKNSQLIAVNKGRYFMREDGLALMAGPFVAGLEFATGKTATVVGKPSSSFFHAAATDVSGEADVSEVLGECVMIGDDALDDVQGAMDAGIPAILVRTGKYQAGDEERCRTPPLAVVDSFREAVEYLQREGLLQ